MKNASSNAVRLGIAMLAASLSLLTACGGGGSATATSTGPPPSSGLTTALVNVSDSPSDRVIVFELTIDSVALTRSDGSQVTLQSKPSRVEVTHVAGSAEPLAISSIPQGTYINATLGVSAPDVIYIDDFGNRVERQDGSAKSTVNFTFAPALQIGAQPVVLTIDFDARQSLSIDPVKGTVGVNPVVSIRHSDIAANEQAQDVGDGALEHIIGQVNAVSANSFTISIGASGTTMTFNTGSATSFMNSATSINLVINDIVRVEGRTQPDGSVLAKEVEVISVNGIEAEGTVSAATGSPVTSFQTVVQDGCGIGTTSLSGSEAITVNVGQSTNFVVDAGSIDLSGLGLPAFSASSLSNGQRIAAESQDATSNDSILATSVRLQQQPLVGSISAVNGAQFTLSLPSDSAFTLLTGKSTVHVLAQQNTALANGVIISPGATVVVRGLVFFDPAQGKFTMVAGRILVP